VLIALTTITVGASFLDLGAWHIVVGLTIGLIKALLVALIFMHLIHSQRVVWIVFAAGFFWLGILMVLTLADYLTRHWLAY
jgi:cytochrome c oxidase subunit 4